MALKPFASRLPCGNPGKNLISLRDANDKTISLAKATTKNPTALAMPRGVLKNVNSKVATSV